VEADNVADIRMWAFCTGFRNLLAGIGAIVGLVILWTGDEAIGRAALRVIEEESSRGAAAM
jgi:putative membrane protein